MKVYVKFLSQIAQEIKETKTQKIEILLVYVVVTPHAQRERGKVIDRGVHIYTSNRKTIY